MKFKGLKIRGEGSRPEIVRTFLRFPKISKIHNKMKTTVIADTLNFFQTFFLTDNILMSTTTANNHIIIRTLMPDFFVKPFK